MGDRRTDSEGHILDHEEIIEKIKKWMNWADTIATAGLFFVILKFKLGFDTHFHTAWDLLYVENWRTFVQVNGILLPTALVLFADFIIIRNAAKRELDYVVTAFSSITSPQIFANVIGYRFIPLAVAMFYVLFLGFVVVIDQPVVLSVSLIAWNAMDLLVALISRRNLLHYVADARFDPPTADPLRPWILQRRDVARDYFLHWFYVPRIFVLAAGNAVALFLAMGWPVETPKWAPYVIIMGVPISNELIMGKWRRRRERRLASIRRAERQAIVSGTGEAFAARATT